MHFGTSALARTYSIVQNIYGYLHAAVGWYYRALSKSLWDVCLLKEEIQENNLFAAYGVIYRYKPEILARL